MCAALAKRGDQVVKLVRRPTDAPDEITWIPGQTFDGTDKLEGVDAVLHLAGANIAETRWTDERLRVIRDSRTASTAHLVDALHTLSSTPVLLQISATGFYGNRGDDVLTEQAEPGVGELATLTQAWELAGEAWETKGRRCVLRLGAVLGLDGGMLQKVLPIFRRGLGGRLGNGKQWFPWITIDDVCDVCLWLIDDATHQGVFNCVAPQQVTNAIFTQALGTAVNRPTFCPVPKWILRSMVGPMADELLLASQRVQPDRLLEDGFQFSDPAVKPALARLMASSKPS